MGTYAGNRPLWLHATGIGEAWLDNAARIVDDAIPGQWDPDSLLHDLLVGAIEDCKTVHTPERRCRPARSGRLATTWSPSAAKAAATFSGQITA